MILLSYSISPGDSCWNLVSLGHIPDRAVLFAESASRTGGDAGVDLAVILEMSGRFQDALRCYDILLHSASDTLLAEWLTGRINGCRTLDTLVILRVIVTNRSETDARDITVEIPLPESHYPYQRIEIVAGCFSVYGEMLRHHISILPGGTSLRIPLVLEIKQEPYSFRPFTSETLNIDITLHDLAEIIRSVEAPEEVPENGSCLQVATLLKEKASLAGLELMVVGGLYRTVSDSLIFHAWNLHAGSNMPIDVLLFKADSLRGMGHCTTDLLPLWDYGFSGGHEASIVYPPQKACLSVSMDAVLTTRDSLNWILNLLPGFTSGSIR